MQLPWHKPYSQIPKQPAAYGSLAVPILSRSLLGGAAEKAGCTNNNTGCTDNLSDRNQINESCDRQIYVVQQQQQQQQKHSTMAHSFNLPTSVVIDCTANEFEVAPRLINLPQATDRSESGSHNLRRIASDAVLSTVSPENSTPVNAIRCTSGIGGEGRPLDSFNSPESGDKLNFYSANNDSLTDGEAEESVLDLSSSPDEGSESSDEGLYSDSPSSSTDEKESQKIVRPVSCTGGIAEGMRLGQIADGGAAVISERVSCLTFIPGALPPPTTRRNEGDSSGHVALLPLDIGTVACPEGKDNTCQALSSAANLYPTGDLKRIIGQSGCPIQRYISAEQGAFSASCDVSPTDRWSDRGKENCCAAASIVNVNSEAHRSLGCSLRLDLKLQPHSVTVCTVEKEKTAYGAGAGAGTGTGLSHKAVSQGEKRKLYDTVAIMSDSRGGRGKRPKSSMRVASIKSFFAPR